MFNIIASSFFQKKHCYLPGIGSLTLHTQPAETDFVNAQIKAPFEEIFFKPPSADDKNGFNEFSAISELMQKHLNDEGNVEITGVGTFIKDTETGEIRFTPVILDKIFIPPVFAERVIRQDAKHAILVGDKETTNTAMTDFFNEKAAVKQRWWIFALLLATAGMGLLSFYLYQYGFNAFGNVIKP